MQVDYVIREAKSLDNLAVLYEGWTPWVWTPNLPNTTRFYAEIIQERVYMYMILARHPP